MDAFRDYSGCLRYVDVLAIEKTVGTLKREAIHVVLHTIYHLTIVEVCARTAGKNWKGCEGCVGAGKKAAWQK